MLFSIYVINALTIAIALTAGLLLSADFAIESRRNTAYLFLALTAFLIPAYRSEGAIVVGGMALALIVTSILSRRNPDFSTYRCFLAGFLTGAFGIAGYAADIIATRSIASYQDTYYADPLNAIGGRQTDVAQGAWIALIKPWKDATVATPWLTIAILSILIGAVGLRLLSRYRALPVIMFLLASLSSIGFLITNDSLIPGLIATTPLIIFAAVWLTRKDFKNPKVRLLGIASLLCFGGLIATIHGDGGADQWGGRLFQVTLPLLLPLMVIGLHNAAKSMDGRHRIVSVASILVVVLSLSLSALIQNRRQRVNIEEFRQMVVTTVEAVRRDQNIDPSRLLTFVTENQSSGTSRALWQDDVELRTLKLSFRMIPFTLTRSNLDSYDAVLVISNVNSSAFEVVNSKLEEDHSISVKRVGPELGCPSACYLYSDLPIDSSRTKSSGS